MNLKNDMIGYPILMTVILITGLLGAAVNGLLGLIIFLVLCIPSAFIVDSFFIEYLQKPNSFAARFPIYLPITKDEVAPGEGAFNT